MEKQEILNQVKTIIANTPKDWISLTTHRLDIYNESLAKSEFLDKLIKLIETEQLSTENLQNLPTAFDYIRLGHPLSSVLEWAIAEIHGINPEAVISFSSQTMPILAVLRKNLFEKKKTTIYYQNQLPKTFNETVIKSVYGYQFETKQVNGIHELSPSEGSAIYVDNETALDQLELSQSVDFLLSLQGKLGSVLLVNKSKNKEYISEIQHVRRRETIAMTPANSFELLHNITATEYKSIDTGDFSSNKLFVEETINKITNTAVKPVMASSGLSMQYAIMMGLIDDAQENYAGKAIKIIVPPNCYGGTNDQARRVAACLNNVEIMDLHVDGGHDMVSSIDHVLEKVAQMDAVPYIIAEIPTNPRVEVPDLESLNNNLSKKRKTKEGNEAVAPVFILDQTFCPNVQFLGEENILASVRTISYVSGSKFPSGGKSTAGYCVTNKIASDLMTKIEKHLVLCDNEATALQTKYLAEQMPSMNERIAKAYINTRKFVSFIEEKMPDAKINFVSEELASQGFTPSVFSLDLPTKGETAEERETYKRSLNEKLINMMITEIPNESKYCVSYGQLKGCYWTIPATSTQGTTKEADKDYIARVSLSPDLNLEKHKEVFLNFLNSL